MSPCLVQATRSAFTAFYSPAFIRWTSVLIMLFLQHTPVILRAVSHRISRGTSEWSNVHNLVAEFPEQGALKGLGEKIGNHLSSRAILDGNFLGSNPICDKEIPDVEGSRLLAARGMPVLFQENITLIVLINHQVCGAVTLRLQEVPCP